MSHPRDTKTVRTSITSGGPADAMKAAEARNSRHPGQVSGPPRPPLPGNSGSEAAGEGPGRAGGESAKTGSVQRGIYVFFFEFTVENIACFDLLQDAVVLAEPDHGGAGGEAGEPGQQPGAVEGPRRVPRINDAGHLRRYPAGVAFPVDGFHRQGLSGGSS